MFALLALASAALYGAADFIGGLTSRRAETTVVVVVSQGAGLLFVAAVLPMLPAAEPTNQDWMWGGAAGLAYGIGVALLYKALVVGVTAVVAPVTAVCAVAVPVLVAVLLGERPGWQASLGMFLALAAIVLVSQQEPSGEPGREGTSRSGLGLAFASGIAIGLFFLALARTQPNAGLWPLLAARMASVGVFGLLTVFCRYSYQMPGALLMTAAAGGIVDILANLLFLLASRRGPLTLVVTLASLYPASTVILARTVLGERISPRQWAGVACALAAIVVIVSA